MRGHSTGGVFRAGGRVVVAVVAVLLAVASPMSSAAQDQGIERFRYYLTASPRQSLDNLCIGDRVLIDVTADQFLGNKRATDTDHVTNPPVQVFGVALTATAGDPDVGTLFPASQRTSARGTPPGSAQFSFAPKKAGSTNLLFEGTEPRSWYAGGDLKYLSTELIATVKECEYDVTVVSHWNNGTAETLTATTEVVGLSPTGEPGHFAGSGIVHWLVLNTEPRCTPHATELTSEVDIIAELEGTDELIVDADFGDLTSEFYGYLCPDDTINSTYLVTYTPSPLTLTVSTSGSPKRLPQTLVDNNYTILNLFGSAEVSAVPARSE